MRSKLILFIVGFIVWCLLRFPPDLQHILLGIVVALLVAFLLGDLFTNRPALLFKPQRYLWALYFIPVFIWECVKANLDIAKYIISPKLHLKPGIIKIKTSLETDTALTYLANIITLTRGAITVDVDKEGGFLYLHCIEADKNKETVNSAINRFENILKRILE
ncbi:MAG: Na+/H+ antiporter subunit E [Candidatus Omnitrophota bacterium]